MITTLTPLIRRLPSWIYKPLAQAYVDYDFPRHIFIETTATCNLACSYCPREKIKEDMDFGLFKSIIDEATHYGPRSFSLHLFGEPLLYPKILDSIRYIKHKNKRHTILLTTNGTLLNRFATEIEKLGVDRIIWSWRRNNFTDETINVLIRIGLIRLLLEETPKEEFEKWSKFPRVEVKHLHNYGGHIDLNKWGLQSANDSGNRWPCYHLWFAPAVRWNGDITICCNDPHGVEVVGRYPQVTLSEMWRGARLASIREAHMKKQYSGLCGACDSWKAYPDIWWGHKCS